MNARRARRRYRGAMKLALPFAAACLLACGGPSTPPEPLPEIELFLGSPAQVDFGGGDVHIAWSVKGADEVSIDPDIGDVTAKTSPVTVHVTATTTWTLTARNASGVVTKSVTVPVATTIDIDASVWTGEGGQLGSAAVLVFGRPVTTADSQGHFAASSVQGPYRIAVAAPGSSHVTVYDGVTRARPIDLYAFSDRPIGAAHSNVAEGSAAGPGTPVAAGHALVAGALAYSVPDLGSGLPYDDASFSLRAAADGSWKTSWTWQGSATRLALDGVAFAFTCANSTCSEASSFDGWARNLNEIGAYGTADSATSIVLPQLALAAVQSVPLSYATAAPPGYTIVSKRLLLTDPLDNRREREFVIAEDTTALAIYSGAAPKIDSQSGTVQYVVTATNGDLLTEWHSGSVQFRPSKTMTLPEAPVIATPPDGAQISAAAQLTWSGKADIFHARFVRIGGGGPNFDVYTTANSTTFPDLSPMGVVIPSGASYGWDVTGWTAEPDDPLSPPIFPTDVDRMPPNYGMDGAIALSAGSTFRAP